MSDGSMSLTLKIWRQADSASQGEFRVYKVHGISPDQSFLEMLDVLNEQLIQQGEEPVAFDHDCREGICGMCSLMINGQAHGPERTTTTCQLHMRHFRSGDTIVIEPWRAKAFPVLRDLVVDRSAFDRIISKGGYVSVNTGNAPRWECDPDSQRECRHGVRSGHLHRLRGLRCVVQECLGHAVCLGQGVADGTAAPRAARTDPSRSVDGGPDGCGRVRRLYQHQRV